MIFDATYAFESEAAGPSANRVRKLQDNGVTGTWPAATFTEGATRDLNKQLRMTSRHVSPLSIDAIPVF
jgi:hypothetical protein